MLGIVRRFQPWETLCCNEDHVGLLCPWCGAIRLVREKKYPLWTHKDCELPSSTNCQRNSYWSIETIPMGEHHWGVSPQRLDDHTSCTWEMIAWHDHPWGYGVRLWLWVTYRLGDPNWMWDIVLLVRAHHCIMVRVYSQQSSNLK